MDTDNTKPQADENDAETDEFDDGTIIGEKPETLASLLSKEFSDDIWLIEGLIPVNGLTILSALPASYKTWILLDVALSVASGAKLFGEFQAKQMGVLIVDEENGERLLQQRLIKLGADPNLPIRFLTDKGFRTAEDPVGQLIDYCKLYDIGLVTFDSLVRIHNASENSADEMSEVFRNLRLMVKEGITVLISHHNRKPGSGEGNPAHEMRGSSDILAALDCHLALIRDAGDGKRLRLIQTKVRLAEELPHIELEVTSKDDTMKIRYMGSIISESKRELVTRITKGVLERDGALNQRQLLGQLASVDIKVNAKTFRSILADMEKDGVITKSQGNRNSIIYRLKETDQEASE